MSHRGRSLPPGKTGYPLYKRMGGPQGRSGQVRKISPPPGFDLRTVQPVAQLLYRLVNRAHEVYREFVIILFVLVRGVNSNGYIRLLIELILPLGWRTHTTRSHPHPSHKTECSCNGIEIIVPLCVTPCSFVDRHQM